MRTRSKQQTIDGDILSALTYTIAEYEGKDPLDLTPPLNHVIDMDAIKALLERPGSRATGGPVELRFTYHGYEVHADSTGRVWIPDAEE